MRDRFPILTHLYIRFHDNIRIPALPVVSDILVVAFSHAGINLDLSLPALTL
jgi:hypothetical protein